MNPLYTVIASLVTMRQASVSCRKERKETKFLGHVKNTTDRHTCGCEMLPIQNRTLFVSWKE
jgi:hypothetical protein